MGVENCVMTRKRLGRMMGFVGYECFYGAIFDDAYLCYEYIFFVISEMDLLELFDWVVRLRDIFYYFRSARSGEYSIFVNLFNIAL